MVLYLRCVSFFASRGEKTRVPSERQVRKTYSQAKVLLYFVFALAERKNEIHIEGKVPLRKPHMGHHVSPINKGTFRAKHPRML
jgi:hypothetical protein